MAVQLAFPAEALWLSILPSLLKHRALNLSDSVFLSLSPSVLTLRRRQELRELRLLQKEEHRNQAQLNSKHQLQLEQMLRRFEQEMTVRGQGRGSSWVWAGLTSPLWVPCKPSAMLAGLQQSWGIMSGGKRAAKKPLWDSRDGMPLWSREAFVGIKHMEPAAWEARAAIARQGVSGEGLFWTSPL